MKIAILITSMSNFGQKGFYNAQEIGLAKELDKLFDAVEIYKTVSLEHPMVQEQVDGCKRVTLHFLPAKSFGINGEINLQNLSTDLDVLVYFSDTQLAVPKVYKWAKKHDIQFVPYMGVTESHSTNKLKKVLIDTLFKRNLSVYQKCHCLVKTPAVADALFAKGVKNTTVAPVGLDLSLLHQDYQAVDVQVLKAKYHYHSAEKVLLFVGRLTKEKQPLRMLEIFQKLYQKDANYRLLMVGKGELQAEVEKAIDDQNLQDIVTHLPQIPNTDIWELYRIADAFVNLNEQEIFGMAILEAMYYECKVVALHAPGPDFIMEDGVSGCLAQNDEEVAHAIQSVPLNPKAMHDRILHCFTWEVTAEKVLKLCK